MAVGKNRTTITDIAQALNITASTVSRALNGHPSISKETRAAVVAKAKQMQYRPNHLAAALRSGRSFTVGIVVPAADRSFFGKVIRGIEDEVGKAGYSVIVCQTHDNYEKEKQVLETLMRSRVDGIIASLGKNSRVLDHYRRLKEHGLPLILFDNTDPTLGVSQVVIDDYRGAFLAVKHLIDQGCQRIAHFAGPQHTGLYVERYRGYKAALAEHNIPFQEELVVHCPSEVARGREAAARIWALPIRPDGLFSSSDYAALGAMQYLKEQGAKLPEDLAIVGFSNEPFTSYIEPALTTVDQHNRSMGQNAAQLFLKEISSDNATRKETVLQPELIIRKSSLRNPKASNGRTPVSAS